MNATGLLFHFLLVWCATDAYLRTYGKFDEKSPRFFADQSGILVVNPGPSLPGGGAKFSSGKRPQRISGELPLAAIVKLGSIPLWYCDQKNRSNFLA